MKNSIYSGQNIVVENWKSLFILLKKLYPAFPKAFDVILYDLWSFSDACIQMHPLYLHLVGNIYFRKNQGRKGGEHKSGFRWQGRGCGAGRLGKNWFFITKAPPPLARVDWAYNNLSKEVAKNARQAEQ